MSARAGVAADTDEQRALPPVQWEQLRMAWLAARAPRETAQVKRTTSARPRPSSASAAGECAELGSSSPTRRGQITADRATLAAMTSTGRFRPPRRTHAYFPPNSGGNCTLRLNRARFGPGAWADSRKLRDLSNLPGPFPSPPPFFSHQPSPAPSFATRSPRKKVQVVLHPELNCARSGPGGGLIRARFEHCRRPAPSHCCRFFGPAPPIPTTPGREGSAAADRVWDGGTKSGAIKRAGFRITPFAPNFGRNHRASIWTRNTGRG
jgi:hypothetical protein